MIWWSQAKVVIESFIIHSFSIEAWQFFFIPRESRKYSSERERQWHLGETQMQRAGYLDAEASLTYLHLPRPIFSLTFSQIELSIPGSQAPSPSSTFLLLYASWLPSQPLFGFLSSVIQRPSVRVCLLLWDCPLFFDLRAFSSVNCCTWYWIA